MKRWLKWTLALLLLALLAAIGLRLVNNRRAAQTAQGTQTASTASAGVVELAETDIFTVKRAEIAQGTPISGTIKAARSAFVKARVSGELRGLTLREGDEVKAGQVIGQIESGEYSSRTQQAQAQAQAALAQATAAQNQYDNNKALSNQGFISKAALDASLFSLNAAQASYRAAQAGVQVASQAMQDSVLKSPLSGQVSQRLAQTGERVGIDSKIIEVVDLSQLELEASLSTQESMNVRVGQTAELKVEGDTQAVKATVTRINPSAQAGSRSIVVYLSIDANSGNAKALRQGLFAQGTLDTGHAPQLFVPVNAVRTDKPRPYVQTLENKVVVYKPVTLGARGMAANEAVVAIEGLDEGVTVVRGNAGILREGTQIRVTPLISGQPGAALPAASQSTSKVSP